MTKDKTAPIQITDPELKAKIRALRGNNSYNDFIKELIEFREKNAGLVAKQAQNKRVRKSNYVGKTTYEKRDHTKTFLEILEVAKVVYSGKKIAISFFSNKAKNGIANLHYDVVASLIDSLKIDLNTIALTNQTSSKI